MAAITYPLDATESLKLIRLMVNEPTTSFWSDEELGDNIILASAHIAAVSLGVIKTDTVTLVAGTMSYTAMTTAGAGGVADILRVHDAVYDVAATNKGLIRIDPVSAKRTPNVTAGVPDHYFHLGSVFGVYPLPSATEATKLITVIYSAPAGAITDLPDFLQFYAVQYAAGWSLMKLGLSRLASGFISSADSAAMNVRATVLSGSPDALGDVTIPRGVKR